ncbi:MAG: hypothetical protein WA964_17750 [Ilumatobacter sp.]|uniref:hypothetical protein n=1 Tax=Ilumatobacter sp. TaxID=1967498 RepID=UPI003C74FDC1
MFVRRSVSLMVVAGLAVAACGGSEESPVPVSSDPVEEAAPPETSADPEPTPSDSADAAPEPAADETASAGDVQMFPDVIGAEAVADGSTWTVSATLSSPYDTPERYADAWRVVGPDGTVFGERILTHDHASEQPFTRSESGIEIPDDVTAVTIEGRDQEFGYGGDTFELTLPR